MTDQEKAIRRLARDLERPRAITLLAEWIAIDKGKTRFQGYKYMQEAEELYDYLITIGFILRGELEQAGYVQLDEDQSFPDTIYGRILKMEAAEVVNDIYRLGFRRIKQ